MPAKVTDKGTKRSRRTPAPRTTGSKPAGRNPAPARIPDQLAHQIIAAPDDPAPYLVLGDQLLAAGDSHGELIVLQHARRERPDDAALAKREKALIKKVRARLLGELGRVVVTKIGKTEQPSIEWFLGFV